MYRSDIGTLLLASPALCTWGGSTATKPKRGGSERMVTSRSGSILGSMPPTGWKRRKPSLAPVMTKPTSSRWASSTTRLAFSLPQRRTPMRLPKRSRLTSSTSGRSSSIARSSVCCSRPEGPELALSVARLARISIGPPYSSFTMALKVWPRWAKFLKWSKEAQAGERMTTSPSSAAWDAFKTACLKSGSIRMAGWPA